ncbi:Asp23/Gls24 family envelope stress response protein [Microbispora sp. NPDC049125]|uniref:Asp23/Gls24 family envelope stress response protein n=1 Tax=Microbispora sp. NPDC049125 TaxID=3154929 RepID=UPI0034658857
MSEAVAVEDQVEERVGNQVEERVEGWAGEAADEPAGAPAAEPSPASEEPAQGSAFPEERGPASGEPAQGSAFPEERGPASGEPAQGGFAASAGAPKPGAVTANDVKGRIKVADEVVEKVAALAALEIPGVADLGGDLERAFESVRDRIGLGAKRATQGVQATIRDHQVAVDVTIVIVYGHVVMDVATEVKVNVARSVSRMLGMRVVEVNVTVDDVRLPGDDRAGTEDPDDPGA